MSDQLTESAERLFSTHLDKDVLRAAEQSDWPNALWDAVNAAEYPAALLSEEGGGFGATPRIARALGRRNMVTVKAIQLSISSGAESSMNQWDGSYVRNTRNAAKRAYAEAGITNSPEQLSLMEVHDCFSVTELVTMEDLFVSDEGRATAGARGVVGAVP